MNRKLTVTGANTFFFIFTVLFFICQILLGVFEEITKQKISEMNIYPLLLINQFAMILIPVIVYSRIKKLNIRQVFRLNNPGIKPMIIIVLCAIPAMFVANFVNNVMVYFFQFIGRVPAESIPTPANLNELVVGILIIGCSPAICEELLNRGIMLSSYENRGSMTAVVVSGIFFGIFHFDPTNFLGPVFLGILIGYYVIKTNSIFAGALAHFTNNALAEVFSYIFRNEQSGEKYMPLLTPADLAISAAFAAAGIFFLFVFLKAFQSVTKGKYRMRPRVSGVMGDIKSILSHWPVIAVLSIYSLIFVLFIISLKYGLK
ncbi:MAG TPA: type II CAAX endopeptidase family protein [Clostridia bacterium]